MLDSFQDCVKCLSEYACNQLQLDIAMEAIQVRNFNSLNP